MTRVELVTPSLPRKCSTTELHRLISNEPIFSLASASASNRLSGKRGSNPPPTAWKAVALPNELFPHSHHDQISLFDHVVIVWGEKDSNLRRRCQQIYSLPHLTTLESPRYIFYSKNLSRWRDSNPRPADYKSAALAN